MTEEETTKQEKLLCPKASTLKVFGLELRLGFCER